MKRIMVLATGGTIASVANSAGLHPGMSGEKLLEQTGGLGGVCEVHAKDILSLDSSNIQAEEWQTIARAVMENLDAYDVIFLGFPNWWGDMPMALYSFLEQVDLSGKTIVPFVTSGGSGFSSTVSTIEGLESGATVQEGLHLRDSSATNAQVQINEWLSGLGYAG